MIPVEFKRLIFLRAKFQALLFFSPFLPPFRVKGWKTALVAQGNALFEQAFLRVPVSERAVLLPHCLIHHACPAKFSKDIGIVCIKCKRCRCGEIKQLAEDYGYQFYITPSTGFTRRLAQRKQIHAAIGTTCLYEIEKGIKTEKITLKGVVLRERRVIPQVHLTYDNDCINNGTDWEGLINTIERLSR